MNVAFAHVETNVSLKQAKLENGFYNIIDGARVSAGKTLSVINPATGQHLAAVPDVDRALLNKAINDARNAFSGWGAVPFKRRKAILASLLNKIDDHADELSALLSAEQGGLLAQARWEIDLLTKEFGPALMQMEPIATHGVLASPAHDPARPDSKFAPHAPHQLMSWEFSTTFLVALTEVLGVTLTFIQ
jgi:hypothetical protein